MTVNPAYVRNALRYLAGALVLKGYMGVEAANTLVTDPFVVETAVMALGVVLGVVTEVAYGFAKKMGWRT